jgi:uncharacterized protein (TIGR04141 family)
VGVICGGASEFSQTALNSQLPAGLLVIRRAPNSFVLSFGRAWQKLENHCLQIDSGQRVALNSIARDKLIGVGRDLVGSWQGRRNNGRRIPGGLDVESSFAFTQNSSKDHGQDVQTR